MTSGDRVNVPGDVLLERASGIKPPANSMDNRRVRAVITFLSSTG